MNFADFHNRLRIMLSIDRYELERAGIIGDASVADDAQWVAFRTDPFRAFLRMDDERAQALWRLIDARAGRKP